MNSSLVAVVVDLLAVFMLVLGLLQGLRHGLTGEVSRLLNVLFSALLGIVFCDHWAPRIQQAVPERQWAWILAFASIAVVSCVVLASAAYVVGRVVHPVFDQKVDRAAGALSGLAFGAVLVVLVFLLANMAPSPRLREVFGDRSLVGRTLVRELPKLHPNFERMLSDGELRRIGGAADGG